MDPTTWLIGIVTILVIYYLLTRRDNSYPPGPFAFPFIGNLPQLLMIGSLMRFLEHYRKQYGNLYTMKLTSGNRVVVSGYDTLRNVLVKNADHTSNRSTSIMSKFFHQFVMKTPGMVWAPFPHWKTLRSFTISTLREEGMGKASIETAIVDEVEQYIAYHIMPNLGKPFNMTENINHATSNIISQMLFARRFEYDDKQSKALIAAFCEVLLLGEKISRVGHIPFSSTLAKKLLARQRYVQQNIISATLKSYIDESKRTIDRENPRDLMDRYIIHSESTDEERKRFFSDENAVQLAQNVYIGGTETTSIALRWALLYMCLYPEIKEKVQREIDDVIGPSRQVTCKDRVSMPYTDAVLYETLRKGNISYITLPHKADINLIIDGVMIPAGAHLLINITSVHYDETIFEEPERFKPERYLTGDIALKKQRTIPFGIGRRACPGESLAKAEYFIFFVTFLQKFDISLPDGVIMTDDPHPDESLARYPPSYELIFTSRH